MKLFTYATSPYARKEPESEPDRIKAPVAQILNGAHPSPSS
jgi:hypothetical protein